MKKILLVSSLILITFLVISILKALNYTYISAKFKELRPIQENIPVYYKGIIIGKAKERKHSKDFNHTLVKIVLYPKKLLLPKNTAAILKKEKRDKKEKDFLELIYPKNPSNIMLSNGSIIEGKVSSDIDTFLQNQNPDDLEAIKRNFAQSIENLNKASLELANMFQTLDKILLQNRKNIYSTTENIENLTKKIDNSFEQEKINATVDYIEKTTDNIAALTGGINGSLPTTMENVNGISSNINAITCGMRKTLRKRFGGLRLIFGQVIDECNN